MDRSLPPWWRPPRRPSRRSAHSKRIQPSRQRDGRPSDEAWGLATPVLLGHSDRAIRRHRRRVAPAPGYALQITSGATRVVRYARKSAERDSPSSSSRPAGARSTGRAAGRVVTMKPIWGNSSPRWCSILPITRRGRATRVAGLGGPRWPAPGTSLAEPDGVRHALALQSLVQRGPGGPVRRWSGGRWPGALAPSPGYWGVQARPGIGSARHYTWNRRPLRRQPPAGGGRPVFTVPRGQAAVRTSAHCRRRPRSVPISTSRTPQATSSGSGLNSLTSLSLRLTSATASRYLDSGHRACSRSEDARGEPAWH